MSEIELFQPKDKDELQAWFISNQKRTEGVWIVIYKKASGKQLITLDDIQAEAVCHGWVDSKVRSIDEERSGYYLTPRKPGSNWTEGNKHLAEKMIAEGRMTVHGMDIYALSH